MYFTRQKQIFIAHITSGRNFIAQNIFVYGYAKPPDSLLYEFLIKCRAGVILQRKESACPAFSLSQAGIIKNSLACGVI
ncbi:MAG: hypothetical protein EA357_12020 [Micavibrio sp.]|nr:MAG: hypothetical protein EA357_12020 [Micavibrio sp.]